MKKILTMLVAVCSLALIFTSCKKDEVATDTLIATEWTSEEVDGSYTYNDTVSFAFNSVTVKSVSRKDDQLLNESSIIGSYVYNEPNVEIQLKGRTLKGVVSGNTLTFPATEQTSGMILYRK